MDFLNVGRVTPRSLLLKRVKSAALGGEPDAGFERDFASLAFSYIKDKAPMLVDHLVGFQLLERSPDAKKAAGVFGSRIGKQWFYLPSIFQNGEINGHEVCYLKNQDVMIPLKENWINYIISQKSSVLGEGRPNSTNHGALRPDYVSLLTPPHGKSASERSPRPQGWAAESGAIQDFARLVANGPSLGRVVNMISKSAQYDVPSWNPITLEDVASRTTRGCRMLRKAAAAYPLIRQGIERWYGKDFFDRVEKKAEAYERELSSKLQTRPVARSLVGSLKAAAAPPNNDLQIYTSLGSSLVPMSDEIKTRVIRDGYAVLDKRAEEKIAVEFDVEANKTELTSPTETGVYEVLMEDGDFVKCYVFLGPKGCCERSGKAAVVRKVDGEGWRHVDSTDVLAQVPEDGDDIKADEDPHKWFSRLPDAGSVNVNKWYMYVTADGLCTAPFYKADYSSHASCGPASPVDDDEVCFDWAEAKKNFGKDITEWARLSGFSAPGSPGETVNRIRKDSNGDRIVVVRNTVHVPKGAKLVSLGSTKVTLGDMQSAMDLMLKKTAQLKLLEDGNEILINGARLSKQAGFFHLIQVHGFRETDAKRLMKSAAEQGRRGRGYVTRVKYAAGQQTPMMASDFMQTSIPFPNMETNSITDYMPRVPSRSSYIPQVSSYGVQYDKEHFVPSAGRPNYQVIDDMPDEQLAQMAQQASQRGDKEMFDAAGFGAIFKGSPRKDMLHQYLPKWSSALDGLCRAYLTFLWFGPALAEQYGDADMPEMKDSLVRAIDVLGDVVLEVKNKTIEPYSGTDSGPDLNASQE